MYPLPSLIFPGTKVIGSLSHLIGLEEQQLYPHHSQITGNTLSLVMTVIPSIALHFQMLDNSPGTNAYLVFRGK